MGVYDRDYYRTPTGRSGFGGMNVWSVNTWLIAINIAVFIINNLFVRPVYDSDGELLGHFQPIYIYGFFSINAAVLHGQIWRFLTFQFLHANLEHVAFNMIALFFFGPMVEMYLGSRRYLVFYLLCGFAGPIMYMVFWATGFLIHNIDVPLVGASAGIFGVLIAGSQIAPDTQVLIYGIIPVKFRIFAWGLLAYAVYIIFARGENAGGQAAHLGGAAVGFALITRPQYLNFINARRGRMTYRS